MTTSLRPLSVLTLALAAAGAAHAAEPAVDIYGFVDVAVGKETGQGGTHMLDDAGSRLGFKGEQDVGHGLTASFQIEARFTPQTGEESKPFWKGGAYGALAGSFGKVIAGRWWSQAFLKSQFAADPFGEATVGLNYGTVGCGGGSCVGAFWVDNSVSYENSFGPVSVGVQMAEKPAPGDKNPVNGGVSYAQGGLYVGLGYEKSGVDDSSWSSATVNYDFGAVKLYSGYGTGKDNAGASHRNAIVGFDVPVGDGHVIGAFDQHRVSSVTVTSKAALGYQYSLNKNAKLFATVANDSKAASDKTGYDVGMIYSW
ncbi:MAG TPA: porin [Burkholderiaceae bacterium]